MKIDESKGEIRRRAEWGRGDEGSEISADCPGDCLFAQTWLGLASSGSALSHMD